MGYRSKDQIVAEIVRLREERGVSQAALAEALGVDQPAVSKLERGERGLAAAELATIAQLFDVTVDELLREDEEVVVFRGDRQDPEVCAAVATADELIENYLYFKALAG